MSVSYTREFILKQIENYINKYGNVNKLLTTDEGKIIYNYFRSHNEYMEDVLIEMGYRWQELKRVVSAGYFDDFNRIEQSINTFIQVNNRFPTRKEIQRNLRIDLRYVDKFGGINGLKKILDYNDINDLIDLRGDYNGSVYEYQVANFLIENGLKDKYKREQHPFSKEEGYYRSDFTFYEVDRKEIHIEIWGYDDNPNSEMCKIYNAKRKIKEDLYKKYTDQIILISLDCEIFQKTIPEIIRKLYEILIPYLHLEYKDINYKTLLAPGNMSEDEIFEKLMESSIDENTFPIVEDVRGIVREIRKRGYTYFDFAKKYNKELSKIKNMWSNQLVFDYFEQLADAGLTINTDNMNNISVTLSSQANKFDGFCSNKLNFLQQYLSTNKTINKEEVNWLIFVANNRTTTSMKIKPENINLAKEILYNCIDNTSHQGSCINCGKTIDNAYVYTLFCDECEQKNLNGEFENVFIVNPKYSVLDYEKNFLEVTNEPFKLTTKGFNEFSKIKVFAYRNYFHKKWIDVVKSHGKFDELYDYIKSELIKFQQETGLEGVRAFSDNHKYIEASLIDQIGRKKLTQDCGFKQKRYTDQEMTSNFNDVKNIFGYVPACTEFISVSKIDYYTYSKRFKLLGTNDVYDNIVKHYCSPEEFEQYKIHKEEYKIEGSKKAAQNNSYPHRLSDEQLEQEFKQVFENYYQGNGKYPTRRKFNELSKHDDSVYRRKYNMKWSEIGAMYGYEILAH
jgi:hypothetical protein